MSSGLALDHGPALRIAAGASLTDPACVPLVFLLVVPRLLPVERAPLGVIEVGFVRPDVPAVVGPRGELGAITA